MKENTNTTHRLRQGKTAGLLGLICNLALSSSKIFIGLTSGAISVTADGLNNLSDAASSVITFLGFHFSSKPADRRHPYGHARFEYLSGLTVAALMLVIAFELAKSALTKIFHPELISVSPLLFAVLAASVAAKAFLALYCRRMGTKIDSAALLAAAEDSRNDTLTTLCVIAVAAAEYFIRIPLDGYASAFLSVFLFYSGLKTVKRTVSPLLGESGDPALRDRIRRQVLACESVLGCHDLMIHDYGPHQCYATIHVETDGSMGAVECHALMDRIERDCLTELGVHLVIHHDPVHTDDPEIRRIKQLVETVLKIKNEALLLHDFRLSEKNGRPLISFDLVVPERFGETPEAFQKSLCDALLALDGTKYEAEITFDLQ